MKSINKIKTRKKIPIVPIIAAVAVIAIGVAVWFFFFKKQVDSTTSNTSNDGVNVVNYDPPTEEEKQQANQQKDEIIKKQEQSTPTDPTLSVTLSRHFQDTNGYNLRTVVDGTTTGECVATFAKAGQPTVTKTFAVTFEATSAFCKDSVVPLSDFAASGSWDLSLVVKKDAKQSSPTTATVQITK